MRGVCGVGGVTEKSLSLVTRVGNVKTVVHSRPSKRNSVSSIGDLSVESTVYPTKRRVFTVLKNLSSIFPGGKLDWEGPFIRQKLLVSFQVLRPKSQRCIETRSENWRDLRKLPK